MSWLLLLRFAKLLAVLVLFAGSVGAVMPAPLEVRRRFAHRLAGPGFGATWALGILLTWARSISLLSTWLLLSFALSLVSLHGVLYAVGKEGRRTRRAVALVVLPLVATLALMVFRPA